MKKIIILTLAVAILCIAGCGKQINKTQPVMVPDNGYYVSNIDVRSSRAENAEYIDLKLDMSANKANERQVIKSASIRLEAIDQDTVHARVNRLADKYEGYVLSSRNFETTIRIPSIHFNDAISEIDSYGNVISKNISGQDITDDYNDLSVRLDNAEKTRQRYLALLDKAVNISEMLKLETELERINLQIETLKGKLEKMSHLVEYSSITVNTSKAIRPGPIGYVFYGISKGLAWLFVR